MSGVRAVLMAMLAMLKIMDTINFLRELIAIPALSGAEGSRADFVAAWLAREGLAAERIGNNIMVRVPCGRQDAQTVMFCSHIDTVRPSAGYTFDPFSPPHDEERIYGLGSNDAGGAVTAMIAAALHFARHGSLTFDLLLLLAAEEETSGAGGIRLALGSAGNINCAIVGEPTQMRAAVAERGLIVLDGMANGTSAHAAHGEGCNAIYEAMCDIETLRGFRFSRRSPLMGDVRMAVTQIAAGTQHNVIPDRCTFVVDVRPTDIYTNEEIVAELQAAMTGSTLTPRSLTNRSSATPVEHPLFRCIERLGIETYVSPTTSDWVCLGAIPAVKMGPGDSRRSHSPDEFIFTEELAHGVAGYVDFLECLSRNF